ncbi:ABC transporter substrate-binding protein [Brachyspira hampsonii]|uniref:ABC transporter substrate-binding protein n=1 Tax=Brachyspira hampsonii TaxID=1287055 RepID=UPI0024070C30|nr:ABC transporter substrate-binding protein [Brachyspira hampsonii]
MAALPNLYSFGTNVYLDDMINIIGASNIFSDKNSWITTAEENVLFTNPDIIFTSVNYIDNPSEEILNRKSWQNINAIKNKDVYYIDSASLPTHNIVNALIMMAKYIYPNEYKDIEIIRN